MNSIAVGHVTTLGGRHDDAGGSVSWSQAEGAWTSEKQPPLEIQTTAKREWGGHATASISGTQQASWAGCPAI